MRELSKPHVLEEGPLPAYDAFGVDRTLVRWMLSLTPDERLAWHESVANVLRGARRVRAR
jgi:hypothetical protein